MCTVQVNEVPHGGQVRGVLGERRGNGRLESGGAVRIQQLDEASGEGTQMYAAAGGKLEEPRGTRGRVVQPIGGPMGAPGAFLGLQRLDMGGIFDLRAASGWSWSIG